MATFFTKLYHRVESDFDNLLNELKTGDTQKEIKAELLNIDSGLKVPRKADVEGIVSHITRIAFKDKKALKDYYKQNICCFFETIDIVLKKTQDKSVLENLFKALFFDLVLLTQDYRRIINEEVFELGFSRKSATHCRELYNLFFMMVYDIDGGIYKGDKLSMSLVVLREIIETKFRRAFGAYAIVNCNGKEQPLDMRKIFDAVEKHKNEIIFAIPLCRIRKIYDFCNIPIHYAYIPFQWTPVFLGDILKNFIYGVPLDNGACDIDSGIITTQETIDVIREEIENPIKLKDSTLSLSNANGEYQCHIIKKNN